MGIYFNPDNIGFRKDTNNEIYVDKTGLLEILNKRIGTSTNCLAVSHARRFGKSQAARMIDAYYSLGSDSKELFSKFEIAKKPDFEEHLNKYNVIHLDIASFADFYKDNLVEKIWDILYDEIKDYCPTIMDKDNPVGTILMQVYNITRIPLIIIIDEWDCVVRNHSDRQDLVHKYLQFLHALFKSKESKSFLALAYVTGILPIKKIEDESALNNFMEYTMVDAFELTPYFGFTEDEVKDLCKKYEMDFDSVKEWYNGYHIGDKHMYNPNSVYMAMIRKRFEAYWKNTSSFSTINNFIALNFDGLKEDVLEMLSKGRVPVNVSEFKNDLTVINTRDDALTALIHLGYLGYEKERGRAYIPNFEVSMAFQTALGTGNWKEIAKTISKCEELLWATIDKEEKVTELLELAHETYTSIRRRLWDTKETVTCPLSPFEVE